MRSATNNMKTTKKEEVIEILDDSDSNGEDDEIIEIVEAPQSHHDRKPAAVASMPPPGRGSKNNNASTLFQRPTSSGDCPICFCEFTTDDGVLVGDCGHGFCQDCFSQYVKGKVGEGQVLSTQLVCPHVGGDGANGSKCGTALAQRDILACLDKQEDRDRYLRLSLSRAVDEQDNMGCCPTAGCSFQFEWDEDNRKLDCPLCQKTYCLVCRTGPWHTGMRCEQNQQQREEAGEADGGEDADFQKFARSQKLKQCPKCKFWVEKSMGCDAMHCRCNLVFCYRCGGCSRGTANKNNFKECKCGITSQIRAHEGTGFNHNLMPGAGWPPAGGLGRGMPMVPGNAFGVGLSGHLDPWALMAAGRRGGPGGAAMRNVAPFIDAGHGHRLGGGDGGAAAANRSKRPRSDGY
jgi:hypothetical protein